MAPVGWWCWLQLVSVESSAWGRGTEAGAPMEPSGTGTGMGDSRSVALAGQWDQFASLAAEAGQGGAVRCLLAVTALPTRAPRPPWGCLAAWVAIALLQGPFLNIKWPVMLVPCWPASSVQDGQCEPVRGDSSRGLGYCGCTRRLHLCAARVAKLLWGHDGLRALGLLVALLPRRVCGCGGGTFPLYGELLCCPCPFSSPSCLWHG